MDGRYKRGGPRNQKGPRERELETSRGGHEGRWMKGLTKRARYTMRQAERCGDGQEGCAARDGCRRLKRPIRRAVERSTLGGLRRILLSSLLRDAGAFCPSLSRLRDWNGAVDWWRALESEIGSIVWSLAVLEKESVSLFVREASSHHVESKDHSVAGTRSRDITHALSRFRYLDGTHQILTLMNDTRNMIGHPLTQSQSTT